MVYLQQVIAEDFCFLGSVGEKEQHMGEYSQGQTRTGAL